MHEEVGHESAGVPGSAAGPGYIVGKIFEISLLGRNDTAIPYC